MMNDKWETVIGLEIHAVLNTKSKLFSGAPNRFGAVPNTNISEVCMGQPGSLPMLNKEALRKAVQFGCVINGRIQKFSKFDRKSYFQPDSPKNFQLTQFESPLILGGSVTAIVEGIERKFAIHRAHLEEDTGIIGTFPKSIGIDYNRAGMPLIEIVSEPCIHSPKEAVAYTMAVRAILQGIDACDCNMQAGSLRIDANISVRLKGENGLRNKAEIKDINSLENLEIAIQAESKRQIKEYKRHPEKLPTEVIPETTFQWDIISNKAMRMRPKKRIQDYRYMSDPDLVPIVLTDAYIENIRQSF